MRTAKGEEYEQSKQNKSSPKAKAKKGTARSSIGKPKANRKIIFTGYKEVSSDKNNNASMRNVVKLDSNKTSKIIDPCFKNVWNKECVIEGKRRTGKMKPVVVEQIDQNRVVLQVDSTECTEKQATDGIVLDVDGNEELDYVDDVMDGSFSEHEIEIEKEEEVNGNLKCRPEDLMDEDLANHPRVKNLFNQFWKEKMTEITAGDTGKVGSGKQIANLGTAMDVNLSGAINKPRNKVAHSLVVNKPPSDTTIYAPALQIQKVKSMRQELPAKVNLDMPKAGSVNQIVSDFVDAMRLGQAAAAPQAGMSQQPDRTDSQGLRESIREKERRLASADNTREDSAFDRVRDRTDKAVIEAEKFRATVANPGNYAMLQDNFQTQPWVGGEQVLNGINGAPEQQTDLMGGVQLMSQNIPNIGSGVSDDDFFHLTCHIDPSLIHKIEKGEFIELEKLLPKDKMGKNGDENRLEWVHRDGNTFLVPAGKDTKISSFHKWEQAFRAYATIYCGAPHRSKEIWQYITVINTVASSYIWDNVYNYDITF